MLKNFLKLTLRNLLKNKVYVIINIIGMGLALSCCIVAYLNYDFAQKFDRNHENVESLYKIHVNKEVQDELVPYGITPLPLGHSIKEEFPSIKKVSRYATGDLIIKKNDNVLKRDFAYVDKDYLDMFTYPLKYGSAESLMKNGEVIISAKLAETYFGNKNPVGELLSLIEGDKPAQSFIVGGVLEEVPLNTSMQFDGLMSFDNYLKFYNAENTNWSWFIAGTFIMVDNADMLPEIEKHLQKYVPIQNEARNDWIIHDYHLSPMTELGKIGRDLRSHWMWAAPHPASVIAPPIMAFLMLLIACFNFTNTSIAISSKRLKEIGIRKVMGSNRNQLISQFLGENLILCLLAIILGALISVWLVPAYGAMWENTDLAFNLSNDFPLVIFLVVLLGTTALIAGGYPSLFISGYQPVRILRGNAKIGGTNKFSFTLLGLQFAFTVMAIFASIVFVRNAYYQENLDVGFEKETIVYAQVDKPHEAVALKNRLVGNSKVASIAVASEHIGRWTYSRTLKQQEKEIEVDMLDIGLDYAETMELDLIKGRLFNSQNKETDEKFGVVVNEELVRQYGWQEPIGQKMALNDSVKLNVVGVVKDFYYNGFWVKVQPTALRLASDDHLRFVVARTSLKNTKSLLAEMKEEMLSIAPNKPFFGEYQEDVMKEAVTVNKNIIIIFGFLGILAVILSAIGLFTLVSLNVIKRIKEIGIRKVLGASIPSIIKLMNKKFILMILISGFIGSAGAFFIIDALIASIFEYYQPIDFITIIGPVLGVTIISMLVSSSRIFTSASKNPVESLRYE